MRPQWSPAPDPSIRVQTDVLIRRSPDAVFRYVAEDFFRNYRRWSPEVIELRCMTAGPLGIGTRGRQVRVDFGRRTQSIFKVVVFERGRRIDFCGVSDPYRISYQFEGIEGKTRLSFVFEWVRSGMVLRTLEKPLQAVLQKSGERVVRNIKRLLEVETPGTDASR